MALNAPQTAWQHASQPGLGALGLSRERASTNELTTHTKRQVGVKQGQHQHQLLVRLQRFICGQPPHFSEAGGRQVVFLQPGEQFALLELGQGFIPAFGLSRCQGVAGRVAVTRTSQPDHGAFTFPLLLVFQQGNVIVAIEPPADFAVAPAALGVTGEQAPQQRAPRLCDRLGDRHPISDYLELPGLGMDVLPEVRTNQQFQHHQAQAPPVRTGCLNAHQPFWRGIPSPFQAGVDAQIASRRGIVLL